MKYFLFSFSFAFENKFQAKINSLYHTKKETIITWTLVLNPSLRQLLNEPLRLFFPNQSYVAHLIHAAHQVIVSNFLREVQHGFLERRDEVLAELAFLFYNFDQSLHIKRVQGCVHFVQDAKRCWLAFLYRQNYAQWQYCFLPSRELAPLSDPFLGVETHLHLQRVPILRNSLDFLSVNLSFQFSLAIGHESQKIMDEVFFKVYHKLLHVLAGFFFG